MKPIELPINAILNHSESGDILFDPFAGSGTCLIAAEQTGRTAHCMELTEIYTDVIVSRYCKFTGTNQIKRNGIAISWEL